VAEPPDPLRGFRGPVAATLVLEVVVVLLTLLVIGKVGDAPGGAPGIGLVLLVAGALLLLLRYAGRPWVAAVALALQAVLLVGGLLIGVLAILGVLFGSVWFALLLMRRDVARKLALGRLPGRSGR
jgi:predicted membrane protein